MTQDSIRLLGISGSTREGSFNSLLLRTVASLLPAPVSVVFYNDLLSIPPFDPTPGLVERPQPVNRLREMVAATDGVLFSTPEYAFGVPGILKNALDWLVGTAELNHKPVAVISASPSQWGGDKALHSLLLTLSALGTKMEAGASLAIPFIRVKINEQGQLTDPDTIQQLEQLIRALLQGIRRQRTEGTA